MILPFSMETAGRLQVLIPARRWTVVFIISFGAKSNGGHTRL